MTYSWNYGVYYNAGMFYARILDAYMGGTLYQPNTAPEPNTAPVIMQEVAQEIPVEEEPCPLEQMAEEIKVKMLEYGFDPEEVESWIMEQTEEWKALD